MGLAVDVMVTGDREEAIPAEAEGVQDGLEELGGTFVFFGQAPVGRVAGEADEIDAAVLGEVPEVIEPGVTEDALAPPRLGLAIGAFVEIGEVENAEPMDRKALRDVIEPSYTTEMTAQLPAPSVQLWRHSHNGWTSESLTSSGRSVCQLEPRHTAEVPLISSHEDTPC